MDKADADAWIDHLAVSDADPGQWIRMRRDTRIDPSPEGARDTLRATIKGGAHGGLKIQLDPGDTLRVVELSTPGLTAEAVADGLVYVITIDRADFARFELVDESEVVSEIAAGSRYAGELGAPTELTSEPEPSGDGDVSPSYLTSGGRDVRAPVNVVGD